jgi:hypothetical protein
MLLGEAKWEAPAQAELRPYPELRPYRAGGIDPAPAKRQTLSVERNSLARIPESVSIHNQVLDSAIAE